jgi:hypothetical protein
MEMLHVLVRPWRDEAYRNTVKLQLRATLEKPEYAQKIQLIINLRCVCVCIWLGGVQDQGTCGPLQMYSTEILD